MSYCIRIRAENARLGRSFERTLVTWPATLGRGATATCRLEGDESVSNVHACIDLRDGNLVVSDVRSTNGTLVAGRLIAAGRWFVLGEAETEHAVEIGGWRVFLRAVALREAVDTSGTHTSATVTEAGSFLTSFMMKVDQLSEPVQRARAAREALDRALVEVLVDVPEADRGSLAETLRTHYAELQDHPRVAPYLGGAPGTASEPRLAALAALAALDALSREYVDPSRSLATAPDVRAFESSLRQTLDGFVRGLSRALGGMQSYREELLEAGDAPAPKAEDLARSALDWGSDGGREGSTAIRRAFHEIVVHQLASFNAVMSGIRELLRELSPASIEAAVSSDLARLGFWQRTLARFAPSRMFLRAYVRRHRDLSSEESAHFAVLFGSKFADRYHQTVRETKYAGTRADVPVLSPAPVRPATPSLPPAARTEIMAPALRRGGCK